MCVYMSQTQHINVYYNHMSHSPPKPYTPCREEHYPYQNLDLLIQPSHLLGKLRFNKDNIFAKIHKCG